MAVMQAESGCHADHINNTPATGDYSVGLFQINLYGSLRSGRPSTSWLLTAENNINYAYDMYRRSGWQPWTTFTTGIYLIYER